MCQFVEYTYIVKLAKFQLPSFRRSAVANKNSLGGGGAGSAPPRKIGLSILLKPDFHSHFSLVSSEILRMGHAQSGETNRIERKNIFPSVRISSSNISTSAKISYRETNQTSFLNHVDISRGLKNFYKMVAPQLYQA